MSRYHNNDNYKPAVCVICGKPQPCYRHVPFFERGGVALTIVLVLATIGMIWWLSTMTEGAEVKLAWNPNPETDIAGYKLFVGTQAGVWNTPILTGKVTTYTLPNLDSARMYYFGLKALNNGGLESDMSAVITHTTQADTPPLDRAGWTIAGFSSEEVNSERGNAVCAIDGDANSFWHTTWSAPPLPLPPHFISIGLPKKATVSAISYLPRQDGCPNGNILSWELQSSIDGALWDAWGSGQWGSDPTLKTAQLPLREIKLFRLWVNDGHLGYASAAEINLDGTYVPDTTRVTPQFSTELAPWADTPPFEVPYSTKLFLRFKVETPYGTHIIPSP